MGSFTEGPWEVEDVLCGHDWAISAPKWSALALVVAEIDVDGDGRSFTKSEEGRANAHLIAAASEMYKALVFVQGHCALYGAADAAREFIDAALAKADGKQASNG